MRQQVYKYILFLPYYIVSLLTRRPKARVHRVLCIYYINFQEARTRSTGRKPIVIKLSYVDRYLIIIYSMKYVVS